MARHQAREWALRILFEHDLSQTDMEVLVERLQEKETEDHVFAQRVAEGVVAHQTEIDGILAHAAVDWKVERMATIDRNVLRIGIFELQHEPHTPISVIISEALELAGEYSTDDAKRFINGVLSSVARDIRPEGDLDRMPAREDSAEPSESAQRTDGEMA